jgi:hypothetical protein
MTKPLVPIVEEIKTQLIKKEDMHNVLMDVDMEKRRMQKVVSDEMITRGEDDIFQYLEDEDVEIIVVQEPLHQQLEKELLP